MISLFKKYNWLFVLSGNDPLVDIDPSDINSVAGVLKLYFRELREPLFPLHLFDELIACSSKYYYTPAVEGILFYLCPSFRPSQDIFGRIFLSNYWWQKSDIWSQASYRYTILWEDFFGPVRFLLPVCRLSWFLYTLNIYAEVS